ncbi:MAG: N-acetyltransferase, partial [Bacteroidota bacterium]
GDINTQLGRADFMMKKVGMDFFDWIEINQNVYSWDNNIETLKQGNFEFYVVFNGEALAAYFIINPQTNYLAQFDVFENNSRNWERLFSAIGQVSSTIRINNVDTLQTDKLFYLVHFGLKNTIDQYQMELNL